MMKMRTPARWISLMVAVCLATGCSTPGDPLPAMTHPGLAAEMPALVLVETRDAGQIGTSPKAGFFVAPDRVVTARHNLLASTGPGFVNFGRDGVSPIDAIIDFGEDVDIAVLRIAPMPDVEQDPAPSGENPAVCDEVHLVTRDGENGRLLERRPGIVQRLQRQDGVLTIETTALSQPGYSGGIGLDHDGRAAAIVTSGDSSTSTAISLPDILNAAAEREFVPLEEWLAAKGRPRFPALQYQQAHAADDAGERERAIALLEEGLKADPACWEIRAMLARLLHAAGRAAEAEAVLAAWEASGLRPDRYHATAGARALMTKDFEAAVDHYRASLAAKPSGEAFAWLVHSYTELHLAGEAAAVMEEALAWDPMDPSILARTAYHSARLGEDDRAMEFVERLQRVDCSPTAYQIEATAHRMAGRPDEALAAVERGLSLHPDEASLLYSKIQFLLLAERDAEALATARHATSTAPTRADLWRLLGYCYVQQEEWDSAAQAFERQVRLKPDDVAAMRDLVRAFHRAGKMSEADRWLQRMDQLDPYTAQRLRRMVDDPKADSP